MWKQKETIKLKDIEGRPRAKKARRKKHSIKDPNRKKGKNLDKKKVKVRVKARVKVKARKRSSKRRKKKANKVSDYIQKKSK